jgi:hypothetical protein
MHRTEGDYFVIEDGKRRFHDRALPLYHGTVDTAEYNNAVQEEIANVIEHVGFTLAADAGSDRAAGWHQLRDAIFLSGKIGTAAITDGAITHAKLASAAVKNDNLYTDLSLSKFSQGTINVVNSANSTGLLLDADKFRIAKSVTASLETSLEIYPFAKYNSAILIVAEKNGSTVTKETYVTNQSVELMDYAQGQRVIMQPYRASDFQPYLRLEKTSSRYAEIKGDSLVITNGSGSPSGKCWLDVASGLHVDPIAGNSEFNFAGWYSEVKNSVANFRNYATGTYIDTSYISSSKRNTSVTHAFYHTSDIGYDASHWSNYTATTGGVKLGIYSDSHFVETGLPKNTIILSITAKFKANNTWNVAPVTASTNTYAFDTLWLANVHIWSGSKYSTTDISDVSFTIEIDGNTLDD